MPMTAMRLRARNGATTRQFLLGIIAVAVHLATTTLFVAAGCCDTCLAQTDASHAVITYDPLIHDQCSVVKGICCYECAFSHGNVNFGDGVTFDDDNNAVATAGTPITFQFNGVSRVTYDFLRENQKKTSFVGNQSTQADKSGDVFSICVKTAGTIAFRGWGTDSCKQVTTETTVTVKTAADGASAGTCAAVATVKPADTSGSSDSPSPSSSKTPTPNQSVDSLGTDTSTSTSGKYDVKNCNLNRGSVISTSDGTKICECAGDWRNPPACDEYSWTKTILTIAGAVATVVRPSAHSSLLIDAPHYDECIYADLSVCLRTCSSRS